MIRDLRLRLASLTAVNTEIALYVFGEMDVSNGLSPSAFTPEREKALGTQMVELGETLRERADDRARTVEGQQESTEPPASPES
ncbi:MAG: hypothetical protein ABIQ18_22350 [Umezawaea sp.]